METRQPFKIANFDRILHQNIDKCYKTLTNCSYKKDLKLMQ